MYDYIPMKFNFDYKRVNGSFFHYYMEAVTEERKLFKVADAGADKFFMNNYSIDSLILAMERGSLINGMTLGELQDAYDCGLDDDTDINIGSLL